MKQALRFQSYLSIIQVPESLTPMTLVKDEAKYANNYFDFACDER